MEQAQRVQSGRHIDPKLTPKAEALRRALAARIQGEVRFDALTRGLYATDASNYQIYPLGVALPRDRDDVIAAVRICLEHEAPLTPRGAGTGLSGQAVGAGVILDLSKYMNRILEVNADEGWAWVQPGVVLDQLNAEVARHRLQFAPDVATSSRATIGGMIANNSAGSHSLIYGMTIDHVHEIDCVLSDGSIVRLGEVDEAACGERCAADTLEGRCFAAVTRLAREHADEIDRRYPKIMRRVSGYNLNQFVPGRPINLARIVIGSEGTLAVILEARVRLIPLPTAKALCVIHFDRMRDALEATNVALEHKPSAVELIDELIITQAAGSPQYARLASFVAGKPQALLAVEFYDENLAILTERIARLEEDFRARGLGYHYHRAMTIAAQNDIWALRKAGLGLIVSVKGDAKPNDFVDDTAVPVARLPEYIERFVRIVEELGSTCVVYAHASVGCLHVRPVVNLKTAEGCAQYAAIAERIADLAISFGGSVSAEHGDGRARSPFVEKAFGPVLYGAFREIKRTFDPRGLLNPGLIVDPDPITAHLRYGPDYVTPEIETALDFSNDGGMTRAAEMCSGVGHCRKRTEGTMCPSYMATMEEQHSTRGRGNVLRLAMTGQLGAEGLTSREVFEAMELCLECKACKTECPSYVDIAKLKYEFLYQYYKKHGVPLRARLFAHVERLMALGSATAPLSSWIARGAPARWFLERFLGIDRRRGLPPFARQTFAHWFENQGGRVGVIPADADPARAVILFHDTFLNHNEPEIGQAVCRLLWAAGWNVYLPEKKCCGRPMISKGLLDEAKANARHNVAWLYPLAARGFRVIGCEPSCLLTFRDDYLDLLRGEERRQAKVVAGVCLLFEEFVAEAAKDGRLALDLHGGPKRVLLHGHCHQKALAGTQATKEVLARIPDCVVEEIDSGCCGMAGSFGYEAEHFEVSRACGERRLMPAVREAGPDTAVVAPGTSCRQQIRDLTGKKAWHPAELLASLLARPTAGR